MDEQPKHEHKWEKITWDGDAKDWIEDPTFIPTEWRCRCHATAVIIEKNITIMYGPPLSSGPVTELRTK